MRYPCRRGFTLIELVVVLFIAGLAVAIASVSINRAMQKSILKDQAARLHSTLRHARDLAIMERAPVEFYMNTEEGTFWLVRNGSTRGTVKRLPQGLSLEGDNIVFFPKGYSTGGWAAITRDDGRGYKILIDKVTGIAKLSGL